jgi:energy-coupling factor transporter ATP-binding protein EcfA2
MLKSLTVTNFTSFANKTTLSFDALNTNTLKNNFTKKILKGLLLVGGNASGKSNLYLSLNILIQGAFSLTPVNFKQYICAYGKKDYFDLEYIFEIAGTLFNYDIRVSDKGNVLKECLKMDGKDVVTRSSSSFELISKEKELKFEKKELEQTELVIKKVFKKASLIKMLGISKFVNFLKESVVFNARNETFFTYSEDKFDLNEYCKTNGTMRINEFLKAYEIPFEIKYAGDEITHKHNKLTVWLPLEQQSYGNQSFLKLLPIFFHTFDKPSLLIIDEYYPNFSNSLEELAIRAFFELSKQSQLLLISHSTNILKNHLFKTEQIYSVTLTTLGSIIYRFSDYPIRESMNLEKLYLSGALDGNIDGK